MKTLLEIYCQIRGWQGGTIHQCHDDFISCDDSTRDKICSELINSMSNISNYKDIQWFTQTRIDILELEIDTLSNRKKELEKRVSI